MRPDGSHRRFIRATIAEGRQSVAHLFFKPRKRRSLISEPIDSGYCAHMWLSSTQWLFGFARRDEHHNLALVSADVAEVGNPNLSAVDAVHDLIYKRFDDPLGRLKRQADVLLQPSGAAVR
jgi:hypothetical protein